MVSGGLLMCRWKEAASALTGHMCRPIVGPFDTPKQISPFSNEARADAYTCLSLSDVQVLPTPD